MAPRNNDASTSYKKNFQVEDSDAGMKDIVPCLLHKKHKVVKLVKNQMEKIHEEGLLCGTTGTDVEEVEMGMRRLKRDVNSDGEQGDAESGSRRGYGPGRGQGSGRRLRYRSVFVSLLLSFFFLLTLFLLILLMVWISAGPLSNTMAHTPVPVGSFVQTEEVCSLEKKYLLRWSKPEYFE